MDNEAIKPSLDPESQQLLTDVEMSKEALKEARPGKGELKKPNKQAENELGEAENEMKHYAREIRGAKKYDPEQLVKIRLHIMRIRLGLSIYLPEDKLREVFGPENLA